MNRHFLFSALFSFIAFVSFGQGYQIQSKYFVYLQTEPAQPFYIKINNQKIEANASGYLILPQLKDGDYKLIIGFPQAKVEEQAFDFQIDSKDKGYLIKDYGADGWGLFDLQTMAIQKATKASEIVKQTPKVTPKPEPKKEEPKKEEVIVAADGVSDFTKVLSQAAKDPSLLETPKPEPVEEKPAIVEQVIKVDNTITKEVPPAEVKTESPIQESKSASGEVKLIYDDRNDLGQVDPITIYISAPKAAYSDNTVKRDTAEETKSENLIGQNRVEFKVVEKAPIQSAQPAEKNEKVVVKTTNGLCKNVADENDFLKLRRTMASQTNDDAMIEQAKKAFADKCYTTAQVKYLSSMFLSNAGKYNFYAAAQSHIADKENFASLASEIKDSGYQEKFNALLK